MGSKSSMVVVVAAGIAVCSGGATADSRHATVLMPPVSPACISSSFGPRVLANQPQAGTYHNGVDLPAAEGAAVLAAAPGTVIRVQRNGPGGSGQWAHKARLSRDLTSPCRAVKTSPASSRQPARAVYAQAVDYFRVEHSER